MKHSPVKRYIALSFILIALAVLLGAFGAHFLEERITEDYMGTFDTASQYHFINALGMGVVLFILDKYIPIARCTRIFLLFLLGIILFSGSLYIISIADLVGLPQLKIMGAVAPIGGISLVAAWAYAGYLIITCQRV